MILACQSPLGLWKWTPIWPLELLDGVFLFFAFSTEVTSRKLAMRLAKLVGCYAVVSYLSHGVVILSGVRMKS
jgi:hypothetical protein